jgi:hypothetical protein
MVERRQLGLREREILQGVSLSRIVFLALAFCAAHAAFAEEWQLLFNGRDLEGWQVRGNGVWSVMPDQVLLGQRKQTRPAEPISAQTVRSWFFEQAWLYTEKEYSNYDLHLEYFLPPHGNSGISIRDQSRAHFAISRDLRGADPPLKTNLRGTPARNGTLWISSLVLTPSG